MNMGDPAPELGLIDQSGKVHHVADYRGQWLVLYFYPKDDTPGCTREACAFRDNLTEFDVLGAKVLGISVDNTDSHNAFVQKFGLNFPLLADPGGKTARQYGALLNLGIVRIAKRHSFIIDPEGNIAVIYRGVKPATHTRTVLADLRALQSGSHH